MNNPEYVKLDNSLYKINTDFRVAIECNNIALDVSIGDYERALAIVYKLFGEKGLKCQEIDKLLNLGLRYLNFNKEENSGENQEDETNNLDFQKCVGLIKSSFKFDYNYDPYELEYLHWYDFYNDLENLSTSEFGSCCILSRVLSILNEDISEIKEYKIREKMIKAKEELREKYCIKKEVKLTKEQKNSVDEFYKALGINT